MCGIAGWIDYTRLLTNEEKTIEAMTRALTRRGPDDEGFWQSDHALLGHRRLVVVDPEGGRQPMSLQWGGTTYIIV